jgi:hypothetical protein
MSYSICSASLVLSPGIAMWRVSTLDSESTPSGGAKAL